MTFENSNPRKLAIALDEGLDHEVEFVIYGRAAIALGFEEAPPETYATLGIDAILRPATIDLVLTKMMRGDDEQDMQDAAFLIHHDRITVPQPEAAFTTANLTDVVELQDAFERAKPLVLAMAAENSDQPSH